MISGIVRLSCILMMGLSFLQTVEAKRILVIESYHHEYPWDMSYLSGIRNTLLEDDIFTFEMDTKRVPQSEYQSRANEAWSFYKTIKPDLVLLGDDNALKYLGPRFREEQTPVVYLGINNNPRLYGIIGYKNITGVLERPLLKESIFSLNSLIFDGNLKKVMILFDSGNTSKVSVEQNFSGESSIHYKDVELQVYFIGTQQEWHTRVLSAQDQGFDAIIVGLYQTLRNEEDNHVPAQEILSWTNENSPIPLFAFWDFAVGPGKTIGGLVLFGEYQGQEAAQLAKRIFAGESPSDIFPVIADKGQYLFSRSELQRWNINTETLQQKLQKKAYPFTFID